MAFQPGIPESTEHAPFFSGYISLASRFADPVARLEGQGREVLELLNATEPEKRLYRYAEGKWSAQEALGHLVDTERVFAYRLLRIARGDTTPLAGFDENAYVAAGEAEGCEWGGLVEEFAAVRLASILLVRHLPQAAWTRMGTSNGHPASVRALAFIMIGHVEHHVRILRERYLG